jgi:S-(hydroxymethyl)glutathione dehydrogenase/alcohol dehydrogenase
VGDVMKAAICRHFGAPLAIETVAIGRPDACEVKIRIDAVAICHSDISFINGYWSGHLPAIYGHEAAGTVIETGASVTGINAGERVIVTLMRSCGGCAVCSDGAEALCAEPPLSSDGAIARMQDGSQIWSAMHTGAFAEQVIVHQRQIVPLPEDIASDIGALIGCGVITGYGAVTHVANVKPGEKVAVVGCGGVGINAIQAARISGASLITAIDTSASKQAICESLGASHFVHLTDNSDYDTAYAIPPTGGYDVVLVAVGSASVIAEAVRLLKARGRLVVMGLPPSGDMAEIEMTNLASYGQSIIGTKMGMARIREDIPNIITLYREGKWVLDDLISRRFDFSDINDAIDAAQHPDTMRIIVQMSQKET